MVGLGAGSQLWAFPDVVWNHRGIAFLHKPASPNPEEAGGRTLVRRPRLEKEAMRPLR